MSDKPTHRMREIHGVCATKIQAGPEEYGHTVTVTDGPRSIVLSIGGMTYPAGLTPDEARFIAAQLNAAADRMEMV